MVFNGYSQPGDEHGDFEPWTKDGLNQQPLFVRPERAHGYFRGLQQKFKQCQVWWYYFE